MERIMIIGGCGAGKSTLSKKLGAQLRLPVIHLDQLYWQPGWQEVEDTIFDERLTIALMEPKWIMDGNFGRTLPQRLVACDTIIYLDYSRIKCLYGVMKRVITTYGKTRDDMGPGCPERFDMEFLKFVWHFNQKHRKKYYAMLKAETDKKVIILKNRRAANQFLKGLE